jgi:hypothetical protein
VNIGLIQKIRRRVRVAWGRGRECMASRAIANGYAFRAIYTESTAPAPDKGEARIISCQRGVPVRKKCSGNGAGGPGGGCWTGVGVAARHGSLPADQSRCRGRISRRQKGSEMILATVLFLRVAILGSGAAIGFYKWREGRAVRSLWLTFGLLCAVLLVIGLAQPFVGNNLGAE